MIRPVSDFLSRIADYKTIGIYDTPKFQIELEGIHAYVQAEGATTPRSRIAHKNVTLDTLLVSARPSISCAELRRGSVAIAELSTKATLAMQNEMLGYIREVLEAAYGSGTGLTSISPYYAENTGVLASGLDPLIRHWMRYGGVAIAGDIYITSQLAELTGFTACSNPATKAFSENIMIEQNQNGFIGRYKGSEVVTMMNPYRNGSLTETVFDPKLAYIFPAGANTDQRPLKIFLQGGVESMEATHLDDRSYEMRLDQNFGAGFIYGEQPYMSVYKDLTT